MTPSLPRQTLTAKIYNHRRHLCRRGRLRARTLPSIGGRFRRRAGSARPVPADAAASSAKHWKEVSAARRVARPVPADAAASSSQHWKEVWAARRVGETGASRCGGQLFSALEGGLGGAPGPAGPGRDRCQPMRRPALPGIGGSDGSLYQTTRDNVKFLQF